MKLIVSVAQKLMDKAGKEGKPWISGLFDYRITPQSSSTASPLQLMTQCTPREKNLPQLPSALGTQEMHQTCQELIKRLGNKHEKKYQFSEPEVADCGHVHKVLEVHFVKYFAQGVHLHVLDLPALLSPSSVLVLGLWWS